MTKQHIIHIETIENCPRCKDTSYEYREHKTISKKIKAQPYYFKRWGYCKACKLVQHNESEKVFNRNDIGRYIRNREEMDQRMLLFKE